MLGVLGSAIFLVVWGIISLFAATISIRKLAPRTYTYFTTGKVSCVDSPCEYVIIFIFNMIFWPIIAIGMSLFFVLKIIFNDLLSVIIKTCVKFADNVIPEVKISKKEIDN